MKILGIVYVFIVTLKFWLNYKLFTADWKIEVWGRSSLQTENSSIWQSWASGNVLIDSQERSQIRDNNKY